jgi:hypothetical protein
MLNIFLIGDGGFSQFGTLEPPRREGEREGACGALGTCGGASGAATSSLRSFLAVKIINLIPFAFGHPMNPSHIFVLLKIISGIELSNDLIVPIIFETHYFVHMLCLALGNYLIKDRILHVLKFSQCIY